MRMDVFVKACMVGWAQDNLQKITEPKEFDVGCTMYQTFAVVVEPPNLNSQNLT